MKRNILIGLIVVLFSVDVYAKGGGGSFGINKLSSIRKFGFKTTSKIHENTYGADIIASGEVNVRYRWWWRVRSWSSGSYAKISLKRNGRLYTTKLICIEQGDVSHDNRNIFHNKGLCKENTSSLYMGLNKYLGKIAVNFVVQGKTGAKVSRRSYNDWLND